MMNVQTIKIIKTEAQYQAALAETSRLWGAAENTPDGDYMDILLILIEHYEAAHHAIAPPNPIDAIKFRMEQMGLVRKDLEPFIGSRARVAEVINGRRALSLAMIRRLHSGLDIPLESLIYDGARRVG